MQECITSPAPFDAASVSDTQFYNDHGSLRLNKVQWHYGYKKRDVRLPSGKTKRVWEQEIPLNDTDVSNIVRLYLEQRDLDELIPFKYVYETDRTVLFDTEREASTFVNFVYDKFNVLYFQYKSSVVIPAEVHEWRFPKAVKRGNDVYIKMMKARFQHILEREPLIFFGDWGLKKTPMLYVTVTLGDKEVLIPPPSKKSTTQYDVLKVLHLGDSNSRHWLEFGDYWNKFITNLRKQFGTCYAVRTWQSQERGVPHAHALIYFTELEFSAVWWPNDGTWRLPSRSRHRSAIKNAWQWGTCDIVCVQDTQKAFKDMLKYVLRDLEGGESDLTNGMVWFYRRQSFSISRGFAKAVWGDEAAKRAFDEPSNADLIDPILSNSNFRLVRIEIYPLVRRDLLSFGHQMTLGNWKHPPPVSEHDRVFLEHLVSGCQMVECVRSDRCNCPVFRYKRF